MKKEFNFKCKKCENKLTPDGKWLKTNWIFFMCLGKKGCGDSIWIDIINKIDNQGHKYE